MQNRLKYGLKFAQCPYPEDFPISAFLDDAQTPSPEPIKSLHFHSSMEIGYCYSGTGLFFIDSKVIPFSEGDVCIIFKNEMHIAQSTLDNLSKWTFISLDPEQLLKELDLKSLVLISQLIVPRYGFNNILKRNDYPEICQLVLLLISELKYKKSNYKSSVKAIVWSLMIFLGRITSELQQKKMPSADKNIHKIMPAIEYISSNYMYDIKMQDLANKCFLSVSHFRKLFKTVVHISPSDYINNIKIQAACLLLHNMSKPVLEISESVGFNSLCNFNRNFKKYMGVSPSQWRKSRKLDS
jgi:AraC-like DNA-binding protein